MNIALSTAKKRAYLLWKFRSTQGLIYAWAERGDDYHEHERMIHEATTAERCIVACCEGDGERRAS